MRELPLLKQARHNANRLLVLQMAITAVASVMFGLWIDDRATYSVLVGGAICIIGNWFFIRQFFSRTGARAAKDIVRNMYLGEFGKILLSAILFLIAIKYFHVQALMFFAGYLLAQASYWASPWIFKTKKWTRV